MQIWCFKDWLAAITCTEGAWARAECQGRTTQDGPGESRRAPWRQNCWTAWAPGALRTDLSPVERWAPFGSPPLPLKQPTGLESEEASHRWAPVLSEVMQMERLPPRLNVLETSRPIAALLAGTYTGSLEGHRLSSLHSFLPRMPSKPVALLRGEYQSHRWPLRASGLSLPLKRCAKTESGVTPPKFKCWDSTPMWWYGFPGGSVVKNLLCNAGDTGDSGSNPWVRKIVWRRAWQPTPVFLPGDSH